MHTSELQKRLLLDGISLPDHLPLISNKKMHLGRLWNETEKDLPNTNMGGKNGGEGSFGQIF